MNIKKLISLFVLLAVAFSIPGTASASLIRDKAPDVTNILVIGEDNDNAEGLEKNGNADGQIIVSINNDTEQIVLTSIARDSYLEMSNIGGEKATLIYHTYGIDALEYAIETNFGVHIDNSVVFNYLSIIEIVDSVGGIDLELYPTEVFFTNDKIMQMNKNLLYEKADADLLDVNHEGVFHLTGKQAACYMRIRISDDSNDDFGRTERIRKVIFAIKDKALSRGKLEVYSIARKALPNLKTDFSFWDIVTHAMKIFDYKDYPIVSQRVPIDGSYSSSEGYVFLDYDKNKEFLLQTIYGGHQ